MGAEAESGATNVAGRRALRMLIAGLLIVPVVALPTTLLFMRPPPPDGPWSRWDLLSLGDYLSWLAVLAFTWCLLVALGWAVTNPVGSWVAPVFLCVIPGMLLAAVVGWRAKLTCPSQLPRRDMLDPLPAGATATTREFYAFRGYASETLAMAAENQSVDSLKRQADSYYQGIGWRPVTSAGNTTTYQAGQWTLAISGLKDYSDRDQPRDIAVQLQLSNDDGNCDDEW